MEIYTRFIPALINLHFNIPPYSGCFIIQRLHNYYLTASIRPHNSPGCARQILSGLFRQRRTVSGSDFKQVFPGSRHHLLPQMIPLYS